MLIAILNQSTVVADADVATMTEAIASQVQFDAAPIWDRAPAAVVFYTDPASVPETAHGIATVRFGHPKGNSLPGALLRRIADTIDAVAADASTRVIVLRSSEPGPFCAGASCNGWASITNRQ